MWTQKGKGKAGRIGRLGLTDIHCWSFPGGSDSTESSCSVGDLGLLPGSARSPGEGNGNALQYSFLENPMDRGTWWAKIHGVAKSRIRLSDYHFFFHMHCCCSVTRSCLTLCVHMDCSTSGFLVLRYLYVH